MLALVSALLLVAGLAIWVFGAPERGATGRGDRRAVHADRQCVGRTVTQANFRGKYMLVYFGYTFCPDVCPTTLNGRGAGAMDKLGKPRRTTIRPVVHHRRPGP